MRTALQHHFSRLRKPSRVARLEEKSKAKKATELKRREVYGLVNRRDQYRCRACGHACDPSATDMLKRAHHHHIRYRSRGGPDETSNICLLCAHCHAAVHARELGISGNADSTLSMYGKVRGKDGHWESAA